ncbi:MAG: DUF1987 domain-containing protein [Bacteroidetes bacterium]|nr:DUF1987 domain-containing protein [Bacteroidota bacterium]MBS1943062.1 DUF1987 domain-containing protein [Bacteroidota bacterium]
MTGLHIDRTDRTPEVTIDPKTGLIDLRGCSIPEDAEKFYGPVFNLVERYCNAPAPQTTVRLALDYFNSSSSKFILDLLRLIDEVHASGKAAACVEWFFEPDDLDMQEAGQDYSALLEMPVRLIAKATR